ncbi:MAG: hypothetical protein N2510_07160 [Ignavibacteria bacterium]|nr:hypothetical protein [Ignavibacteria bacterium]
MNKNKKDYHFISPAEYENEEDSTQAEAETQEDLNENDEKPEERTPDEDTEKRARPEMPPPSEPNNQAILNI